jgi:DNA-binding CsgD family transcriptional regulator
MKKQVRLSETGWRDRLLGYARLLAEEALSPNLSQLLAEALSRDHPLTTGIFNYDRKRRLLPDAGLNRLDDDDWKRYREHYFRLNPFTKVMSERRLMNSTMALSRYLPTKALEKTEFYNDFMKPRGDKYALSLSIQIASIGRTSVTFYRGDGEGGDFDDDEVRRFDELRPFLRNALMLRALIRERGKPAGRIEDLRGPAFLVTSGEAVEPLNPAGEDFLCSRCKAAIPNPYVSRMAQSSHHVIPSDALPLRDGREGFLVHVEAPEKARAAVSPRDHLRVRFGLTAMEAVVAVALVDGLSYREIAGEYEISVETVHSHVKAIHHKTGVATTRQFVALAFFDDARARP